MCERRIPLRALRRPRPPRDPRKRRVIRRHKARAPAHLDIEIAERHAAFHRHRVDRRPAIFDHVPARAGHAELRNQPQRHVLGGDVGAKRAVQAHAHTLRPLHRDHLRRQDMRQLRRATAEGHGAEPADGRRVAVGHRMRRARQHHAELRRHHVRDALLGIAEVEHLDAVLFAALAHGAQEGGARRVGLVGAAGLGRDGVVLHREGEVRPRHLAALLLQRLEGVRRVQLMQHVAVDVDQVAAVHAAGDEMGVPDFIEQGFGHGGTGILGLAGEPALAEVGALWAGRGPVQGLPTKSPPARMQSRFRPISSSNTRREKPSR